MKYLKRIVCLLILFVMFMSLVRADTKDDKNLVNIYLFYSDSCIHCASEKELLNEIIDEYDNVRLYKYEVSNNSGNRELMFEIASLMDVSVQGVPFTVIADKPYKGFDRGGSKRMFLGTIEYYSTHGYRDIVGEYIGNIALPGYELTDNSDFYDYVDNYGNYVISVLGFKINTKDLTLSILSIVIGILDGINLCTIFGLIFMINLLIKIKDKQKFLSLYFVYFGVVALLYLLCMLLKINEISNILRIIIGIIFMFVSLLNLSKIFRSDNGILNRFFENKKLNVIKKVEANEFLIKIMGVLFLSVLINLIKVSCSMELPVIFMDILAINNVDIIGYIIYLFIYLLFFLLDDFIILFIVMIYVYTNKFTVKKIKLFNIFQIMLLFVFGLFLIFNPKLLTFSF